jgi:hypothetical protein
MKYTKHLSLMLGIAGLTLVAACGGGTSGGQAGTGEDIFSRDILPLLVADCAGAACHDGSAKSIGFGISASPDTTYQGLFSMSAVIRGDAGGSPLVESVSSGRMPKGRAAGGTYVSTVSDWIDAGALRYAGETPPDLLPPIDWGTHTEEEEAAKLVNEEELEASAHYQIVSDSVTITNTAPGDAPIVTFQIVDPTTDPPTPYTNLLEKQDDGVQLQWPTSYPKITVGIPPTYVTNTALADSRYTASLEVMVSWNSDEIVNQWSPTEYSYTGSTTYPQAMGRGTAIRARLSQAFDGALPTLTQNSIWTHLGDGFYQVDFSYLSGSVANTISTAATGSGWVSIGGRSVGDEIDPVSGKIMTKPLLYSKSTVIGFSYETSTAFSYTSTGTVFNYQYTDDSNVTDFAYTDPTVGQMFVPITYEIPIKAAIVPFGITVAQANAQARRAIVDEARCNRCHVMVEGHGMNRNGDPRVCLNCHNPNLVTTTITVNGAPESLDLKYMLHGIHAGSADKYGMREKAISYGTSTASGYFADVYFPAALSSCEICHLPGTWALPYRGTGLGVSVSVGGLYNDPTDDLRISPESATCYSCHDSTLDKAHMMQNGGVFGKVQQISPTKVGLGFYYDGTGLYYSGTGAYFNGSRLYLSGTALNYNKVGLYYSGTGLYYSGSALYYSGTALTTTPDGAAPMYSYGIGTETPKQYTEACSLCHETNVLRTQHGF